MFGTISPSEHTVYDDILDGREMYLKQIFMHVHNIFLVHQIMGFSMEVMIDYIN